MAALQERFEDDTRSLQAEGDLLAIRQRGRPIKEYIRDFRHLAGKVHRWPERLLVHQFKGGLERTLQQACMCWGLLHRLQAWYQANTELHAEFRDDRLKGDWVVRGQKAPSQLTGSVAGTPPTAGTQPMAVKASPVAAPGTPIQMKQFMCFRCGKPGYRAEEFPAVSPRVLAGTPSAKWGTARKSIKPQSETLQGTRQLPPPCVVWGLLWRRPWKQAAVRRKGSWTRW